MKRAGLVLAFILAVSIGAPGAWAQAAHQDHVALAAKRFALSPELLAAVIRAESAGDPKAVSRAGALGLMQLMPGTWAELRGRLGLGADPFDPRDNILAGAAYLRMLFDRYGSPGFLAAYNAGPGRYEASLAGRPLPQETLDYVAKLQNLEAPRSTKRDWRAAGLFAQAWSGSLGPGLAGSSSARSDMTVR